MLIFYLLAVLWESSSSVHRGSWYSWGVTILPSCLIYKQRNIVKDKVAKGEVKVGRFIALEKKPFITDKPTEA